MTLGVGEAGGGGGGGGGGGESITNDVLKFRKIIEFQSSMNYALVY